MVNRTWPRIVVHVDMDAFFAQVEQRDCLELQGKPVCITNGVLGSSIIARSYEARVFGVKTGMRLRDAQRLCPGLIRQPSRPGVYAGVSTVIMSTLESISPDIEVFSVDEAFLDLSHCRSLYRTAKQVGRLIKQRVWQATHLTCSVGIGGDKTSAKIASKRSKPDGLFIIPPWQTQAALAPLPVTDICGINQGVAQFLAQYGVYYCGQMRTIPISVLAKRFGNVGRRLWMMCQGQDPEPIHTTVAPPKSIGHGKVMPPNTKNKALILHYLCHMAEKVAKRLRRHRMLAQAFFVGLKVDGGWLGQSLQTVTPTQDGVLIYRLAKSLVELKWHGQGVFQCQVTALRPQLGSGQGDLFVAEEGAHDQANAVMDAINRRFGEGTASHATCLEGLAMPDVIAPAWRPSGHRASIEVATTPDLK